MIDSIVIIILIGCAIIGYFKGFIKTVTQLASSILSLMIAFVIYKPVAYILKGTPLYTMIKEWAFDKISSVDIIGLGVQSQAKEISKASSWLPNFIGEQMIKNNNHEVYRLLGVDNVIDYMAAYIANIVIMGVALLLTWILAKILLNVVIGAFDLLAKLPVVATFNRCGGLIAGFLKGILGIWLFMLVVPLISGIGIIPNFQELINDSRFAKLLYDNNFILLYINQLFL